MKGRKYTRVRSRRTFKKRRFSKKRTKFGRYKSPNAALNVLKDTLLQRKKNTAKNQEVLNNLADMLRKKFNQ